MISRNSIIEGNRWLTLIYKNIIFRSYNYSGTEIIMLKIDTKQSTMFKFEYAQYHTSGTNVPQNHDVGCDDQTKVMPTFKASIDYIIMIGE